MPDPVPIVTQSGFGMNSSVVSIKKGGASETGLPFLPHTPYDTQYV
jgi:hypothetical protein